MTTFSDIMATADAAAFAILGTAATYHRAGQIGISCTVILNHDQTLVNAGVGSVSERGITADVRVSEIGLDPMRDDEIQVGTDYYLVESVLGRDEDNLVITLELKRQ